MPYGALQEMFKAWCLKGLQYLEHPDITKIAVCILAPLLVSCGLVWYYLNKRSGGEKNMANKSNTYRNTNTKKRKKRRPGNDRIAQPQSDTLSVYSPKNSGTWSSITDIQSTTLEELNNVAVPFVTTEKYKKEMVKVQQESFNIKFERKQTYAKAVVRNGYSWKTFETAIFYMHKYHVFQRRSASVIMAVNHLDSLRTKGRRILKIDKYEIPEDYSRAETENIFTRTNIDVHYSDIDCTFKEFSIRYGYPPTPEEFQDLYDKTIRIDFMRKELDKLRKTNEILCNEKKEFTRSKDKEIQDLQSELKKADQCIRRSKCKCCFVQEISIVFRPCCHCVFCADCDSRRQQGSGKCNVCPICGLKIKSRLKIYLS